MIATPVVDPAAGIPAGHAVRVLGPLEVRHGEEVVEIAGLKRQALLVLLILNEGRPVSLERMISRLWPHHPPATAAAAVRNKVSALRRMLEPLDEMGIETVGSSYILHLAPGALDAQTARMRIRRGFRLLAHDRADTAERELREALSLWRGALLPNLRQAGYEWSELAELEELRLVAVEGLTESVLRGGRHRDVVPGLQRLVRQHPEREVFHRQRVVALAAAGRPADAITAFHEARSSLRAMGRSVGAGLVDAHRAVLDRADTTWSEAPRRPGILGPVSDLPAVVLCARFGPGCAELELQCRRSAAGSHTLVASRPGGFDLVSHATGSANAGTTLDAALEVALAWRRLGREMGCDTPTFVVVAGRVDSTGRVVEPVDELIERAAGLADLAAPGAIGVW